MLRITIALLACVCHVLAQDSVTFQNVDVPPLGEQEDPDIGGRTFGNFIPGATPPPPQCPKFPNTCRNLPGLMFPRREDYFTCPVDIPYCRRTSCSPDPSMDNKPAKCLSTPGCCYDFILQFYKNYYRQNYGYDVMPGVPLCYKGVQNKVFLEKTKEYMKLGFKFDPRYNKCIMKTHEKEMMQPAKGCEKAMALEFFGYQPKYAGWPSIQEKTCTDMGHCWFPGRGCFYPAHDDISIPSGAFPMSMLSSPNVRNFLIGRERCRIFARGADSPDIILNSYHQCLIAGCAVHPVFNDRVYYKQFAKMAAKFSNYERYYFLTGVYDGYIGPDNYEEELEKIRMRRRQIGGPPTFGTAGRSMAEGDTSGRSFALPDAADANSDNDTIAEPPIPDEDPAPPTFTTDPEEGFGDFGGFVEETVGTAVEASIEGDGANVGGRTFNIGQPPPPPGFQSRPTCLYQKPTLPSFVAPPLPGSSEGCCTRHLCFHMEPTNIYSGVSHYYTPWSRFSRCSASCNGGTRVRRRRCVAHPNVAARVCTESLTDSQSCNTQSCPKWGRWSKWGKCTRSCGTGSQTRQRACMPPGMFCPGEPFENRQCQTGACPVYGPMSDWSPCSTTCGVGTRERHQDCIDGGAYGCPKNRITESLPCTEYCGRIEYGPMGPCNTNTCFATATASCLYQGQPGYCGSQPPASRTQRCFDGLCICHLWGGCNFGNIPGFSGGFNG